MEKHIQQFSQEDINDFSTEQILQETQTAQDDSQKDTAATDKDQVLQERLEALPAEKKEALLELLG